MESQSKFIKDYIKLVNLYQNATSKNNIGKALYIFIYDYPYFRNLILETTGVNDLDLAIKTIELGSLKKHIKKFRQGLDKNSVNIFLLNDSQFFIPQEDLRLNYPIKFRRKDTGSKQRYFTLFSLINKAAISSENWSEFRVKYRRYFIELIEGEDYFFQLSNRWGNYLKRLTVNKSGKVTFVDSGMQATLALFLAESLVLKLPNMETDIKLFCTDPWLSSIFTGKYYTTDADYLFSLERAVEQSSKDSSI